VAVQPAGAFLRGEWGLRLAVRFQNGHSDIGAAFVETKNVKAIARQRPRPGNRESIRPGSLGASGSCVIFKRNSVPPKSVAKSFYFLPRRAAGVLTKNVIG
jgi:hypothetical protein